MTEPQPLPTKAARDRFGGTMKGGANGERHLTGRKTSPEPRDDGGYHGPDTGASRTEPPDRRQARMNGGDDRGVTIRTQLYWVPPRRSDETSPNEGEDNPGCEQAPGTRRLRVTPLLNGPSGPPGPGSDAGRHGQDAEDVQKDPMTPTVTACRHRPSHDGERRHSPPGAFISKNGQNSRQ